MPKQSALQFVLDATTVKRTAESIANQVGAHVQTVRRHLNTLVRQGLVKREYAYAIDEDNNRVGRYLFTRVGKVPRAEVKKASRPAASNPATPQAAVAVGQVWQDCDKRNKICRRLTIVAIGKTHATCTVKPSGVTTKIRLNRFKPGATGYKLVG